MKKYISYILLIIEAVAIFALFINAAKKKTDHWYAQIVIPEGMLLTIADEASVLDLSLDDPSTKMSTVTIPAGSVVEPVWIGGSSVTFVYDKTGERYNLDNTYFIEQDQLKILSERAAADTLKERKEITTKGFIIGIAVSVVWIIIGILLTVKLLNKKHEVLYGIHSVFIIVLGVLLFNSFMLLEH
jgi:hypothetical protein